MDGGNKAQSFSNSSFAIAQRDATINGATANAIKDHNNSLALLLSNPLSKYSLYFPIG